MQLTFMYAHKLSLDPLKVRMPTTHSRVRRSLYFKLKHYTVTGLQNMLITVTVYILVVIIRYLAHDTSPYFVDDTDGHYIWCVLSILLTTLTVIVFEAKARYGHWTSE